MPFLNAFLYMPLDIIDLKILKLPFQLKAKKPPKNNLQNLFRQQNY